MSREDVLLENIRGVRGALQGVRAARTKCLVIGSGAENLARIRRLETMETELDSSIASFTVILSR